MATQSITGNGGNHHGLGTPTRSRGRSRVRANQQSKDALRPGSAKDINEHIPEQRNFSSKNEQHVQDQFIDAVENLTISVGQNTRVVKNIKNEIPGQSRDNSSSPKPQRSRKSMFDSGIMSRINNHLQESVKERSAKGIKERRAEGIKDRSAAEDTRSLDRVKKESPAPRASHLRSNLASRSPDLRLNIPTHPMTPDTQRTEDLRSKLIAAGRPRSLTDPVPISTSMKDSVTVRDEENTGITKQDTVLSSSVSVSKARGRGRGRGRGRSKRLLEMEASTRPGMLASDDSRPQLQNTTKRDTFHDAVAANVSLDTKVHRPDVSSSSSSLSIVTQNKESSSLVQTTASDSKLTLTENTESNGNGSHGAGRGLTLKIPAGGENAGLQDADHCSPLSDDFLNLLSPNHEFVLDWAAAMETPTPDTSTESAPDWNV